MPRPTRHAFASVLLAFILIASPTLHAQERDGRLSPEPRQRVRRLLSEVTGPEAASPIPQTIDPQQSRIYKLSEAGIPIQAVPHFDLADEQRGKTIPLRITFPQAEGSYPLVIFCHGALGSKDGGQPLATWWASHGYVVIQPTFGDSISLMTEQEKAEVNSLIDLVNSPRTMRHWDDRVLDVKHVIDELERIERDLPQLGGRIDRTRIAVAGHSFGAHTSALIGGLKLMGPGGVLQRSFADERVAATILISPPGTGPSITAESYQGMTRPVLMITGDKDGTPIRGQEGKAGTWRREAFDYTPPARPEGGGKYLLWITDAWHGFGGINGRAAFPGAGPVANDHVLLVKSTCLAFLDAYLKEDAAALNYLHSPILAQEMQDKARVECK